MHTKCPMSASSAASKVYKRQLQNASESGALMMMHAENGIAIDVLVAQSLARGDSDPKYHSYTRPEELESEATHLSLIYISEPTRP